MVTGRESELEKFGTGDFAGREPAEECAVEEVYLGAAAGCLDPGREGVRGTDGTLEFKETFEDADGGVKRRAGTRGRFAVPATVGELFGEEAEREGFIGVAEVAAEREDAAVDAGLFFPFEEGISSRLAAVFAVCRRRAEVKGAQVPATGVVVPAQICFCA